MFSITEIYKYLVDVGPSGEGYNFGLAPGNQLDKQLNTPDLWGHDPSVNDYVPAAGNLTRAIADLVATAERTVDISSLYGFADGAFLEAIRTGIVHAHEQRRDLVVRMIFGFLKPHDTPKPRDAIVDFIAALDLPPQVQLYVGLMQTAINCTNHAKLIVVDGRTAIAGGHNLWSVDYTQFAPAHDLSMQLSGPAVAVAEGFLNSMWTRMAEHVNCDPGALTYRYLCGKKSYGGAVTDEILKEIVSPKPAEVGTTQVLALAREGRGLTDDQVESNDASHIAKLMAMGQCESHVRVATPWLGGFAAGEYDADFVDALCGLIRDGRQVSIILSDTGATTSSGKPYAGAGLEKTAEHLARRLHEIWKKPKKELIPILNERLHLAPLRFFDKQKGDPAAESWKWRDGETAIEPANHAKIYIFDTDGYYFGSENAYAITGNKLGLQEFGFMVSGEKETTDFIENYWMKGWQYSSQFEFKDWEKILDRIVEGEIAAE